MLMNEEQRAAYRDALQEEARGYEARVERAKAEGNDKDEAYYKALIKQVDAEHERSLGEESHEESVDDGESSKKSSKKSKGEDAGS